MIPIVLFAIVALVLLGLLYMTWRFWWNYTQITPEDEEYEDRVATLNDRQSNRISDKQLTNPPSTEDAWSLMVHRGLRNLHDRRPPRQHSRRQR